MTQQARKFEEMLDSYGRKSGRVAYVLDVSALEKADREWIEDTSFNEGVALRSPGLRRVLEHARAHGRAVVAPRGL